MSENNKPKIEFAPGCFDDFEGTQEELDDLVAAIIESIESGELFEHSKTLDLDELFENDPELYEKLLKTLKAFDEMGIYITSERRLN